MWQRQNTNLGKCCTYANAATEIHDKSTEVSFVSWVRHSGRFVLTPSRRSCFIVNAIYLHTEWDTDVRNGSCPSAAFCYRSTLLRKSKWGRGVDGWRDEGEIEVVVKASEDQRRANRVKWRKSCVQKDRRRLDGWRERVKGRKKGGRSAALCLLQSHLDENVKVNERGGGAGLG